MAKTQRVIRYIEVKADTKDFIDELNKINKATATSAAQLTKLNKATVQVERSTKATASSLARFEASVAKASRAIKGFGIIFLAQQLVRAGQLAFDFAVDITKASDAIQLMGTRLNRLGGGGGIPNLTLAADLARDLGVTLEDAADQAGLLAPAFQRLNQSFGTTINFAGDLTKALRVFGTDARRAQIVTVQLAQALSSGQLQGDELRSLVENAGGLAYELEKAVQELLGTKTPLKELGSQGRLTAAVILQAFQKAFDGIRGDMEDLPKLWDQVTARLETSWQVYLATIGESTDIGKKLKGFLESVQRYVDKETIFLKIKDDLSLDEIPTEAIQITYATNFLEVQAQVDALIAQIGLINERKANFIRQGGSTEAQWFKSFNDQIAEGNKQIDVLQKKIFGMLDELKRRSKEKVLDFEFAPDDALFANLPSNWDFLDGLKDFSAEDYNKRLDAIFKVRPGMSKENQEAIRRRVQGIAPYLEKYSKQYAVPKDFWISLLFQESKFDASAQGPMTTYGVAKGIGQFIKGTAERYAKDFEVDVTDIWTTDPRKVETQLRASAAYLRDLIIKFNGDLEKVAAGYNWGENRKFLNSPDFDSAKIPVPETRDYVSNINKMREAQGRLLGDYTYAEEQQKRLNKIYEQNARDEAARIEYLRRLRENAMSEQEKFEVRLVELQKELDSGAITPDTYVGNLLKDMEPAVAFYKEINDQQKALDDATRSSTLAWADWLSQFEELTPEVEKLREGYGLLIADLDAKVITPDEFVKRAEQLKTAVGESLSEVDKLSQAIGGELTSAFGSWIDSAIDGTFNLREALVGLLKDITKVMLQLALINSLKASGFGGFFGVAGQSAPSAASIDALNKLASPRAIQVDVPEEVTVRAVMEPAPFSVTPEINMPTVDPVVFSAVPDVAPMSGLPDSVHVKAIMEPTEITPPPVTPTFEAPKDIHIATILDPVEVSPMPQAVHVNAVLDPVQVAPLPAAMMPRMVAAPAPETYSGPSTFAMPSTEAVRSGYLRTPTTMPMATMDTTAMAEAFAKSGASTSSPPVTVNITESSDKQTQGSVSQRQGQGGESIIDIVVAQVKSSMNSDIARGKGVAAALEAQYGLSRIPGAF